MTIQTKFNLGDTVYRLADPGGSALTVRAIVGTESNHYYYHSGIAVFVTPLKYPETVLSNHYEVNLGTFEEWKAHRLSLATADIQKLAGRTE